MTTRGVAAGAGLWLAAAVLAAALPARGAAQTKLFRSDSMLTVTLKTDLRSLLRDRDTTKIVWLDATISYAGAGDSTVTVPLRVRTRGIYRLKNCDDPPIRLAFDDSTARGTLFKGTHHPKLIVPCESGNLAEQLILQEYAIYRVQQLLTPVSLSARLLRLTLEDVQGRAKPQNHYAFITEDPRRLAGRLGGAIDVSGGIRMHDLSTYQAGMLAVFQYLIGNTDWSLPGAHNIAAIIVQDTILPLAFDYDWSGVVDAPYAQPAPQLGIKSVRERIWRGRCMTPSQLEPVLARFELMRDSITALMRSIPDLQPRELQRTLRYYDDFYRVIADRSRFVRDVVARDCVP